MMRNDYRRALILLRGNAPGYSGHVRLERRTLMGSMYFLLQSPAECSVLRAALVGRDKNGYYACALGEMNRDSRGQAVFTYSFDPRNICSRELEQYQLIAVTCGGDCEVVLYGNVAGHAELDWERVRSALCGLYAQPDVQDEPAARLPAPEELPEKPIEELPEPETSQAVPIAVEETDIVPESEPHPEPMQENAAQTAGQLLGINMDAPWLETVEPLRALFALSVPMENPPDEEYTYIAVAMPEGSGYTYCAVGVLTHDGEPISVRYGLPSVWSAQSPAGLEEYSWVGDQNRGWWMTQVDLYSCRCI